MTYLQTVACKFYNLQRQVVLFPFYRGVKWFFPKFQNILDTLYRVCHLTLLLRENFLPLPPLSTQGIGKRWERRLAATFEKYDPAPWPELIGPGLDTIWPNLGSSNAFSLGIWIHEPQSVSVELERRTFKNWKRHCGADNSARCQEEGNKADVKRTQVRQTTDPWETAPQGLAPVIVRVLLPWVPELLSNPW